MRRTILIFCLVSQIGLASAGLSQQADDVLLRPIAPDYAARWLNPQAPTRIFGNTYLVGFSGLNVALIRTDAGFILIDGALPQAVPAIEANIKQLGFALKDIKYILSTEPHYDHAGGLAALARDTGATVVASAAAADVLRRGRSGPDDPQEAWLAEFPAVQNVRTFSDGEQLRLGRTVITAHATPGHTLGSMSWTWRSCEAKQCLSVVFAASLNPIAADGYRFSDRVNASTSLKFRQTFAALRRLPCDILLTAHPDQSGGDAKFRAFMAQPLPNPFIAPLACRDYADKYEALFDRKIADERAAGK